MARIWDEEKGDEMMVQIFDLAIEYYYLNKCNKIKNNNSM